MSRSCLIVGRGTFGDLFPLFSVANHLLRAGWRVIIVADEHHRNTLAPMKVPFFAVGGTGSARAKGGVLNSLAGNGISDEYSITMQAAVGADVIIGNQGAFVGRIVSKAAGIPWIYCPVSPLALLSDEYPPLFPVIGRLQRSYRASQRLQKISVFCVRILTRIATYKIANFQRRLGVWDSKNSRFEGMYSQDLNLLLTSPHLLGTRIDWPRKTCIPGFAWFEPDFMEDKAKTNALSKFIESGPAPVVIAPGGMVRVNPGHFYKTAIDAVLKLGLRAIVVAGEKIQEQLPSNNPKLLVIGYMPYSQILSRARLLIHSGGIGAIGWALKFGLPSVVVPAVWDQFDNAELVEKNKIGSVSWHRITDVSRLAELIENSLSDEQIQSSVLGLKQFLSDEDGGVIAAKKIIDFVEGVS